MLGGTSLVGRHLLPLLTADGRRVVACSRAAGSASAPPAADGVSWRRPGGVASRGERIPDWISLCPIWAVPEHRAWLEAVGVRRLVAVSSHSVVTKRASRFTVERDLAARIAAAEATVISWAADRGFTLAILRPTMIYDGVADGNVTAIAEVLDRPLFGRTGWFPVCGPADGLRQPVHAADVALACRAAVDHPAPALHYAISGGETLPYRRMIERIAAARRQTPRIVTIPRAAWHVAETVARALGLARRLPPGAATRMNEDLSCGHEAAARDLGFRPRPFQP